MSHDLDYKRFGGRVPQDGWRKIFDQRIPGNKRSTRPPLGGTTSFDLNPLRKVIHILQYV